MNVDNLGLGRLYVPDPRDAEFPLTAPAPDQVAEPDRRTRSWWASGAWLNQGSLPHCVAYSWTHWYADGPDPNRLPGKLPPTAELYLRCQRVDQWPGENYAGTSVRAGAHTLRELGVIREYRWAPDVDTVAAHLLHRGPVVMGTLWYEGMFTPDARGVLNLTGRPVGGHAYLLDGINLNTGLVRVKNSWGRAWGRAGFAFLRLEDLAPLLRTDGEACAPIRPAAA